MNKLIFPKVAKEIETRSISWLVTVVGVEGSTPGKVGMKMIVNDRGEIDGTIGGGAIELRVIRKIMDEKPTNAVRWSFDLGGNFSGEKTGMICGGQQEILIDPLFVGHELYIVGAGHCGRALSELATKCNFAVTVIDDRPEFVTTEYHPFASRLICSLYSEIDQHIEFSPEVFIVIMTHAHKNDELVMRKVLGKSYKYLGVIGSATKVRTVKTRLLKDGFDQAELSRVYSPIGFDIGSQTPYEIAVSITAQLIAKRNNKKTTDFSFC